MCVCVRPSIWVCLMEPKQSCLITLTRRIVFCPSMRPTPSPSQPKSHKTVLTLIQSPSTHIHIYIFFSFFFFGIWWLTSLLLAFLVFFFFFFVKQNKTYFRYCAFWLLCGVPSSLQWLGLFGGVLQICDGFQAALYQNVH